MVMSTQPSQLRTAIHNYFREFGYDTCEIIYQELMRSGSLGGLLRRLGLDDPGFSDDQYAYVLNFLRRSGVQAFMDAMGRNKAPYRVQPRHSGEQIQKMESEQGEHLKRVAKARLNTPSQSRVDIQRIRVEMPGKAEPSTARTAPVAEAKPSPPPAQPSSEPKAEPAAPKPPATGSAPAGADEPWDGVTERRSGRDRRTGTDRRQSIEMVFKNRRFGGDRRSGKERRRNWPPDVWPPEDTKPRR
jgi:hypothetical protein